VLENVTLTNQGFGHAQDFLPAWVNLPQRHLVLLLLTETLIEMVMQHCRQVLAVWAKWD